MGELTGLVSQGSIPKGFGGTGSLVPVNTLDNLRTVAPGIFGGVVCNLRWSDIEPSEGVFDFSQIDAFLALLAGYNSDFPYAPLYCRLRIWAGGHAPPFALNGQFKAGTIGGPLTLYNTPVTAHLPLGTPNQCGLYWHPIYQAAYWNMMQAVAAAYDGNPLIKSVTMTSVSSQDDEAMNELTDVFSAYLTESAGRTDAAMLSAIALANTSWPFVQTCGEFAFTQFKQLDAVLANPPPPQTASFLCNVTKGVKQITVSSVLSGTIGIGNTILGQPFDANTHVVHQVSGIPPGSTGGRGVYNLDKASVDIDASNVSALTFNGNVTFSATNDIPTTIQVVQNYKAALGPLATISNHALHIPVAASQGWFVQIPQSGQPVNFQVTLNLYQAGPPVVDNLTPAVQMGINTYNANCIELHDLIGGDSFTNYPDALLQSLANLFYQRPQPNAARGFVGLRKWQF